MPDMGQADRTLRRTHATQPWTDADDRSINYSKMLRMSREHFLELGCLVSEHDSNERRDAYRRGDYPRSERTKDVNMRYRWDLVWASDKGHRTRLFDALYADGLNDDHIDTALRRIVSPL